MSIVNELLKWRILGPKWENWINDPLVLPLLCHVLRLVYFGRYCMQLKIMTSNPPNSRTDLKYHIK